MTLTDRAFGFIRKSSKTLSALALATIISVSMGNGMAKAEELVNALSDGVAMDGFDVVSYYSGGSPKHGTASHSVDYKGKTWLFSSAANAAKFSAMPGSYEPQNNGWCSYAVSEGYGAEVDFVNGWAVLNDKLYLNWNEEAKDAFVAEQSTRIPQSEANWSTVHAGMKDGSVELYTHAGEGVDIQHPQQPN